MSSHSRSSRPALIDGLLDAAAYPHPATAPRLIETHISWVILAGDYAYKIKKPLNLGFLDFSTLERRRQFCDEELRLNRRLAPDIYLARVAISGSPQSPSIGGAGPAIEWAVQMRAFPADATLDREAEIGAEQIDAIADRIAAFHAEIAVAPMSSADGAPQTVIQPVEENFRQLAKLLPLRADPPFQALLDTLRDWSRREADRLTPHFAARKAGGQIRECHGDLHLGNIAWVAEQAIIFDALEFNPTLRNIDLISEIAFLTMDLRHRNRPDLAWRFLDRYLEQSRDADAAIDGLQALRFYQVYRAMVRAKVAAIQTSESARPDDFRDCLSYLRLAETLIRDRRPALLLMHGVSGSGKSWLSRHLLEHLGAIRLRSDVIRKRLFGLKPLQDSAAIPGGIYTREAGERTLQTLLDQARALLEAGFLVIIDATFIQRTWRAPFQALAEALAVDWRIVSLEAPADVLQARITERQLSGADASEAGLEVLASQLAHLDAFSPAEQAHVSAFSAGWKALDIVAQLRATLNLDQRSANAS
jgi:aminoglycoside phosphotransferase family enzyme/predicted kinase